MVEVHSGPVADRDRADRELAEERDGRAVVVRPLIDAVTPAEPSVAEQDRPMVRAVRQEVGDVVGLYLKVGGVAREARSQLEVADASTIEERLVDAERGGVQTGRSLGAVVLVVELELVSEDVHRSFSGREWFGFVWLDPSRLPVGGLEQSGLERGRVGPRRCARRRSRCEPATSSPPATATARTATERARGAGIRIEPSDHRRVRPRRRVVPSRRGAATTTAVVWSRGSRVPIRPSARRATGGGGSSRALHPVDTIRPSTITCTLVQTLLGSEILLALSSDGEMCVQCTSGRRGATASRGGLQ